MESEHWDDFGVSENDVQDGDVERGMVLPLILEEIGEVGPDSAPAMVTYENH